MAFMRGKSLEGRTTTGALSLGGQYVYEGKSPAPGIGGVNSMSLLSGRWNDFSVFNDFSVWID